jgi:serine/threonine-protein kinase PRP4
MDRSGPSTAPPPPPAATADVPPFPPVKVDPPKEEIVDSIPEEMDEEEALAERRRKRAAILSRFTAEASTAPSSAGPTTPLVLPSTVVVDNALGGGGGVRSGLTSVAVAPTPRPTTPNGAFDLSSNDVSAHQGESVSKRQEGGEEEVSAADYDAAADGQAEAVRRMQVATDGLKGEEKAREIVARETEEEMEDIKRKIPEREEEEEDSEEDMFAVDVKPKKAKKVKVDVPVRLQRHSPLWPRSPGSY